MLRIDLRARQQVVERADAVPGPPAAEELADEELLVAREQVLADADARPVLLLDVAVLQPLALADRVEDQHDVAHPGQALANDW